MLLLTFGIFSCSTQKKTPYYFENVKDTITNPVAYPEIKIQKNDLLSIQVYSDATRPEVDALYNLPGAGASGSGGQVPGPSGFLVDPDGNIQYPRLGVFHAEGLTKKQLADEIVKRLTSPVELLHNPTVIIRFLNFKVSVIGEVNSQGPFTLPNEKVTILDAIALAGGMTDFGRKEKVKVLRERDGRTEIGNIDLSSDSLFHSPYYNLMQNDIVFVEPTRQKQKMNDQSQTMQRATLALSVITAAAFIYNLFR
ncbi:polysaccharide biosynthesis/export family protein [Nostoc ellipsosporum NOK]|nr:polysaccharide biosynthesis/export family protein [Nostoc ellipsosporum NOK]